jgi:hypothetical protein
MALDVIAKILMLRSECLITNGFLFPVCMEFDYYRFTPKFWERRLQNEKVEFRVKLLGINTRQPLTYL